MSDKHKIVLVTNDEWQGVYCDGELIEQDHSADLWMTLRHLSDKLGFDFEEKSASEEKLMAYGQLPQRIEDVTFE